MSTEYDTDISCTLSEEERQPCEVWTRVMGYHRPVASFNRGKQSEHAERLHFREQHIQQESSSCGYTATDRSRS